MCSHAFGDSFLTSLPHEKRSLNETFFIKKQRVAFQKNASKMAKNERVFGTLFGVLSTLNRGLNGYLYTYNV